MTLRSQARSLISSKTKNLIYRNLEQLLGVRLSSYVILWMKEEFSFYYHTQHRKLTNTKYLLPLEDFLSFAGTGPPIDFIVEWHLPSTFFPSASLLRREMSKIFSIRTMIHDADHCFLATHSVIPVSYPQIKVNPDLPILGILPFQILGNPEVINILNSKSEGFIILYEQETASRNYRKIQRIKDKLSNQGIKFFSMGEPATFTIDQLVILANQKNLKKDDDANDFPATLRQFLSVVTNRSFQ